MLCILRIRITGCHTCALRCTDTGLDLSGKTKVCVMWVTIREFRQRLVDCFLQEWHSGMVSRDRLDFYSFKQSHSLADYLTIIKKAVLRRNLIRFRLGVSPLKAHHLRYTDRSQGNYTCPFCKDSDEPKIHFLFVCPKYKTLRETLLEKFWLRLSAFKNGSFTSRYKADLTTCYLYL